MWTGGRFGVILHRKYGKRAVPEPLDGMIVEVDVRHIEIRSPVHAPFRPRHGKTMVLRRD